MKIHMNLARLKRNSWDTLESESVTPEEKKEIEKALQSSEYYSLEDTMAYSHIQDSLEKDHATV